MKNKNSFLLFFIADIRHIHKKIIFMLQKLGEVVVEVPQKVGKTSQEKLDAIKGASRRKHAEASGLIPD